MLILLILTSPLLFVLSLGAFAKIFMFFMEKPGDEERYTSFKKKLDSCRLDKNSIEYQSQYMPKTN